MTLRIKRQSKAKQKPLGQNRAGRKPERNRTAERIRRAELLETPAGEQEELLEETVALNPDLMLQEQREWRILPEVEAEDENAPEILGEMGEDYSCDPDGDFSELGIGSETEPYSKVSPRFPQPATSPDLVIVEANRGSERVFEVEVPRNGLRPVLQNRWRGNWRAERIEHDSEERQYLLWRLGKKIIERQKAYFGSSNASEAYLKLKPLSQEEVARELGINKGSLARLVARSKVQTPRFGVCALNLFFTPAGSALQLRTDVLAAHIREFLRTEDPKRPYSSRQMRLYLQGQKLIPQTRTETEKEQMERLIRSVMTDYNIRSRAQRRRRGP